MTPKRYCSTCGSKMNQVLDPQNQFNTYTGKRYVFLIYQCPKKKWYSIRHKDLDFFIEEPEATNESQS